MVNRPDPSSKLPDEDSATDLESSLDEVEIQSARDVLLHLNKTAKTLKIYLPNNPMYSKFLEELRDRLNTHLMEYETLALKVRQYELVHKGEVIYENTSRMESLAFKLFVDGVRELTILEGIDKEELTSLLDILGREYDPANPDDDIVTLLWETNMAHIRYLVSDEFIEEAPFEETPVDPGDLGNAMANEAPQVAGEDVQQTTEKTLEEFLGPQLAEQASRIFVLSEAEISWLKEQMTREEAKNPLSTLLNILGAILRHEEEDEEFSRLVRILGDFVGTLIKRGDFPHSVQILKFFHGLLSPERGLPEERTRPLKSAIERAGDPEILRELEPVLNHWGSEETETLLEFLLLLSPGATYPLVDLLARLNQMKIRRLVCEALITLAKSNPEPLIQRLNDSRWFFVRNLIYILGKIGDERFVDHFKPLVGHREVKVRKEVVHILEGFRGPRAQDLLRSFIADSDMHIRIQAVRVLAKNGYHGVLGTLEDMIEEPSFLTKELVEKREIFEALGKIGGDPIVPLLQQYVKKGAANWFKKAEAEELGVCAANALKYVGTEKARAVLEDGQGFSNKTIREACRKALAEMNRAGRR